MIGVWDASHSDPPFSRFWGAAYDNALKNDARVGRLFYIEMGGDCGGAVDVYVDEAVPDNITRTALLIEGEFLLRVPSGRLAVDGVEQYRMSNPPDPINANLITIPTGDYAVRCYDVPEDEQPGPSVATMMDAALSPEDRAYYDAASRTGFALWWPLILLPVVWQFAGWKIALAVTLGVLAVWSHVYDRLHKRRVAADLRLIRIGKVLSRAMLAAETPLLILELRRVADPASLTGGSVRL